MQRCIELLIGRLITDEEFRRHFVADPRSTLTEAGDWGLQLTPGEIAAVLATDMRLWDAVADQLDPRLQKASLSQQFERRVR